MLGAGGRGCACLHKSILGVLAYARAAEPCTAPVVAPDSASAVPLTFCPACLPYLPSLPAGLVELYLCGNPLQCLPSTLARASKPQRLCLRGTRVQQPDWAGMPATLERLPHLRHLDLAGNALRSVPSGSYLSRKQWVQHTSGGCWASPLAPALLVLIACQYMSPKDFPLTCARPTTCPPTCPPTTCCRPTGA